MQVAAYVVQAAFKSCEHVWHVIALETFSDYSSSGIVVIQIGSTMQVWVFPVRNAFVIVRYPKYSDSSVS